VKVTRRNVLQGGAVVLAAPALRVAGSDLLLPPANAQTTAGAEWQHALSLFGEVRYPAGFKHFDYVNPNAPKAGRIRQIAIGTFDNLKGAPPIGDGDDFVAGGFEILA